MKKIILIILFLLILIPNLKVFALQKGSVTTYNKPQTTINTHNKVKTQLDDFQYQVYIITEKLIRSNQLDNYSLNVLLNKVSEENEVKSHYIIIDTGLIDSFQGDTDAISFIIAKALAEEISQTSNKILNTQNDYKEQYDQLQARMEVLKSENDSLQSTINENRNTQVAYNQAAQNNINDTAGDIISSFMKGSCVGWNVKNTAINTALDSSKYKAKGAEYGLNVSQINNKLNQNNAEISQIQQQMNKLIIDFNDFIGDAQFITDRLAIQIALRAGYDPDAYKRVLDVLTKYDNSQFGSELINGRLYNLGIYLADSAFDPDYYKKQGIVYFKSSIPLTITKLPYNGSFRINSKFAK